MQCFGCKSYSDRIGILVAQLGTPDAPDVPSLRKYLKQFLSDRRVIEVPRLLWWFILNFSVLRTRPKRSAALYKRIWTKEGSPLLLYTQEQTKLLKSELLKERLDVEVVFGMRYGSPSLETALDELKAKGCKKILLFPMYPQYSGATSASTYDVVFSHLLSERWVPSLRVVAPYYREAAYLDAIAAVITKGVSQIQSEDGAPLEHLVLSYHGIPRAYIEKGDPYCCMCTETTVGLLPRLSKIGMPVTHTYQSRFGKDPWLTPYTDETIVKLAESGLKRIAVACPGFTTDCLETLDEVGNEALHLFRAHGGESLRLIPCLNVDPTWIDAMKKIALGSLAGWVETDRANEAHTIQCPIDQAPFEAKLVGNA